MGEDGIRQEKPGRRYNQTQLCGCRGRAGVEGKVMGGQGTGGCSKIVNKRGIEEENNMLC